MGKTPERHGIKVKCGGHTCFWFNTMQILYLVLKGGKQKKLSVDGHFSDYDMRPVQMIGMMSLSLPATQHQCHGLINCIGIIV